MEINSTVVFEKNWDAFNNPDLRFIVNQGGSRSSKTVSLCQLIILYALTNKDKVISIVRKTFPALRSTVMRDFMEQITELNLHPIIKHNKTEHTITFTTTNTVVEFFSVDDEQKLRGRKRDIGWVNEANEIFYEDYQQLNFRTTEKLIFDYNPSDTASWLYDLPIDESILIKSTYKDNPFLSKAIIKQIEDLKHTDESLYQIYALGERTTSKVNVYSNFEYVETKPERFQEYLYGIDFGYNHPTALVKIYWCDNEIFVEDLIYESYLTTPELINRLSELGVNKHKEIYADYARPEIIQDLINNGYNVYNADKKVKKGIDDVKTFKIYTNSQNIMKEYQNYKWKKVGDKILDEPVKMWDDAMDAIRYGIVEVKKNFGKSYWSF